MKKFEYVGFVTAAVIILAGTVHLAGCKDDAGGQVTLPPVAVRVMNVVAGQQKTVKRFSGYTYPWDAAGVGFLIGGRVTSIKVKEGDHVRKGDLLATIAPEDYQLVKDLTETQVEAIKPNYERVLGLVRDEAIPKAKLDEVEGMYKAAVTQQKQAERQVSYTRLKAPIDGVVINRGTAVGQVIGPGMPAAIVIDISRMKVKFGVTQKELELFTVGAAVSLAMDGIEGTVEGTVYHVALIPDVTTRMYEVTVAADNADERIRPGMLARVELEVRRSEGIFVPLRAIKRNHEGRHVVFTVGEGDVVVERAVTTGELFGDQMKIDEGLSVGDRVILEGQAFVTPGDKVKVL
ncbi:MAG TPA: efflux RND transporter periplasmic adaptor subunit [Myxococcota bacterium]|nr:efflux RND transporter periplasmic adaptor subunit [Myxococcota bacterium]HOA13851.1 efflux RND transporter periplasmic adaptor subunit [Myxococcota bacterium]HOC98675.1 efflux RND transporter periplasmic adaptor subunit [Myxococcota bacterium]HOH76415.1 efflux RND transporter periplasmic adaptor subunit [Myxococcota bacterium]HPV04508.1 efflux RND transporter periplasmic adaptor subunit [Myxococcota bacterium]